MIANDKFEKRMKALRIPAGFQLVLEVEERGWKDHPEPTMVYVLKNNMMEIRFDQTGAGHTNFNFEEDEVGRRTWQTFDRRGVEDSFYHLPLWDGDKTKYNLNAIVKEQIRRVGEYFEYRKTAIPVPGIPHTISPDRLAMFKARLKTHGQISFHPSGFGTGYIITTKMNRGAKPAPKAMIEFFGVGELFISTIEMD